MPLKEKVRQARRTGQSRTGWSRVGLAYGCTLAAAVLPVLSVIVGLIVAGGLLGLGWWWGLTTAALVAGTAYAATSGFPILGALVIALASPALAAFFTEPPRSLRLRAGCAVGLAMLLLAGSPLGAEVRDRDRAEEKLRIE